MSTNFFSLYAVFMFKRMYYMYICIIIKSPFPCLTFDKCFTKYVYIVCVLYVTKVVISLRGLEVPIQHILALYLCNGKESE